MPPKKKPYSQLSKTAKFYRDNPESYSKKKKYDTKLGKSKSQKNKRIELIKKNREADKRGVSRSGRDASHTARGIVYKSVKANRGSKSDSSGDKRARGKK